MLPFARAGFNIFARSFALFPPPAPAPLIICASSMNIIVLPFPRKPANTSLNLSSKSPLYLDPASILPISRLYTSYSFKNSGTLLFTIFHAKPSAIAVLPTPGSPTIRTLFLLLLPKARAILSNSSDLPITGSTFSFCTSSLRFVVNALSALAASPVSCPSSKSTLSPLTYSENASFSTPPFCKKKFACVFCSLKILSATSTSSILLLPLNRTCVNALFKTRSTVAVFFGLYFS